MTGEYLSQTELGRHYGVSSHKIGSWLVELGLRNAQKKPSTKAFEGGFVSQRESRQPDTYFWVWQAEKTMKAFDEAGKKRVEAVI